MFAKSSKRRDNSDDLYSPPQSSGWLVTVLSYDGLLPFVVLAVPMIISTIAGPGRMMEVVSVALPIAAFFWRLRFGVRYIERNSCRSWLKALQGVALFVGLVLLLLVDTLVLLSWSFPGMVLTWMDYLITALLYTVYLMLMTVSLYPGTRTHNFG